MILTANGTTDFPLCAGKSYSFFLAGTFGGGSASISYRDSGSGAVLSEPDFPTLTSASGFTFVAPTDTMRVVISGATSPSLACFITPLK